MRRRRRHEIVSVGGENAADQFTLVRFSGDEGLLGECLFADVEAELGLAFLLVRAVAKEAVVGEDRPDIAVVRDFLRRLGRGGGNERRQRKNHSQGWKRSNGCSSHRKEALIFRHSHLFLCTARGSELALMCADILSQFSQATKAILSSFVIR